MEEAAGILVEYIMYYAPHISIKSLHYDSHSVRIECEVQQPLIHLFLLIFPTAVYIMTKDAAMLV